MLLAVPPAPDHGVQLTLEGVGDHTLYLLMNTSYRPVTVLLAVPPAPDHSVQLILEGVGDLAPGGAALAAPHLVHAIHLEYQMDTVLVYKKS